MPILYRDDLAVKVTTQHRYNTFECQMATVTNVKPPLLIVNIYRPPTSAVSEEFADEFDSFLDGVLTSCARLLLCCDFNCPWAPVEPISPAILSLINSYDLKQHIDVATHIRRNILDLLFDQGSTNFISDINVSSVTFSDHSLVRCKLNVCHKNIVVEKTTTRDFKRFDAKVFSTRLLESDIFTHPSDTVDEFVDQIEKNVSQILDDLVPLKTITKRKPSKPHCWLTDDAIKAKRTRRKLEHRWLHRRRNQTGRHIVIHVALQTNS